MTIEYVISVKKEQVFQCFKLKQMKKARFTDSGYQNKKRKKKTEKYKEQVPRGISDATTLTSLIVVLLFMTFEVHPPPSKTLIFIV